MMVDAKPVLFPKTIPCGIVKDDISKFKYYYDSPGDVIYPSGSWDIDNAFYTNRYGDISANTANPRTVNLSPDGMKMYVVSRDTNTLVQYRISKAWDISVIFYEKELDLSSEVGTTSQMAVAHGLQFRKPEGDKLYIFNRTEVWQYDLSTAWDVSTAVNTGYKDLSSIVQRGHELDFRQTGDRVYIEDRDASNIYQFTLTVPWDIETMTLDYTLDISDQENAVRGISIKPTGSHFWICDTGRNEILQYHMNIPWELSTAVFEKAYDLSGQTINPRSITWRRDGKSFYVTDASQRRVHQYYVG